MPALTTAPVLPVFVEIFSGTGRLGRAAAREGLQVLLWDISFGDAYDLTLGKNQSLLMGWLAGGLIVGFHIALPCQIFPASAIGAAGRPRSGATPGRGGYQIYCQPYSTR